MSIVQFVGVCFFLSCVLFCEQRLKWVRVNRSERPSQSYTSFCYEVWVSEVNVHDFFWVHVHFHGWYRPSTDFFWYEGTSTVNIDRFVFWYESTSTVHFDWFFAEIDGRCDIDRIFKKVNPYWPSILTVFSSRWILIDHWYRLYSQVGESLLTVDIDSDQSTGRLKSNRPIDDTCVEYDGKFESFGKEFRRTKFIVVERVKLGPQTHFQVPIWRDHTIGPKTATNVDKYSTTLTRNMGRSACGTPSACGNLVQWVNL